jgi:hypothetical protein
MIQLHNIQFRNRTGGTVEIFYRDGTTGNFQSIRVAGAGPSAPITGALLTIDVETVNDRGNKIVPSYDFSAFTGTWNWGSGHTPCALAVVLDDDQETLLLTMTDPKGNQLMELSPKGIRLAAPAPMGATQSLGQAKTQLRQCLVASKNRRDLGNNDPNFPDTARYTINLTDASALAGHFLSLQSDDEFKGLYPADKYTFDVATSGTVGTNVWEFKILFYPDENSRLTIFNYHISVQSAASAVRVPRKLTGSSIAATQSQTEKEEEFVKARAFFYATPLAFGSAGPSPDVPDSSIATEEGAVQFHLIGQKPNDLKYSDIMQQNADNLLALGGLVYDYIYKTYPTVDAQKLDIKTWSNVIGQLPDISFGKAVSKQYENRIVGVKVSGEFLSMIAKAIITDGASLLTDFTSYLNSIGDVIMSASNNNESYKMITCTYLSYLVDDNVGGYYDYAAIALRQITFQQHFKS